MYMNLPREHCRFWYLDQICNYICPFCNLYVRCSLQSDLKFAKR